MNQDKKMETTKRMSDETSKENHLKFWNDYAKKHLEGRTIRAVSYMTDAERDNNQWSYRGLVIEFTDGTMIYPSQDDEGNEAGALFGIKNGSQLTFPGLRR